MIKSALDARLEITPPMCRGATPRYLSPPSLHKRHFSRIFMEVEGILHLRKMYKIMWKALCFAFISVFSRCYCCWRGGFSDGWIDQVNNQVVGIDWLALIKRCNLTGQRSYPRGCKSTLVHEQVLFKCFGSAQQLGAGLCKLPDYIRKSLTSAFRNLPEFLDLLSELIVILAFFHIFPFLIISPNIVNSENETVEE